MTLSLSPGEKETKFFFVVVAAAVGVFLSSPALLALSASCSPASPRAAAAPGCAGEKRPSVPQPRAAVLSAVCFRFPAILARGGCVCVCVCVLLSRGFLFRGRSMRRPNPCGGDRGAGAPLAARRGARLGARPGAPAGLSRCACGRPSCPAGLLGGRGLGPAGLGLFWRFPLEPGQLRVCPGLRAQRAGLQAPVEAQRLGLHGLCFSAGIYATEGVGRNLLDNF